MKENIKYVTFDGLDATGKSTLIDSIQRSTKAEVIKSPPEWMRPAREKFDSTSIELRFLYYFFGNVWIDKYRLRYLLNDPKNDLILQDRSLL